MEKFYKPERDKEFFDTCEEIRGQTKDYQSVEDIARKAIVRSASCFFLTQKQIACIIQQMRCCRPPNYGVILKERDKEIFSRYWELKKQNHTFSVNKIAGIIEFQQAPRYYITYARAVSLYYELLKK